MQRRELLKLITAVPALVAFPRWSFAAGDALGRDRLVYIYLRGGADGLTLCPPVGDTHYFDLRPGLAIAETDVLPLDAMFGLHPAATGLKSLYDAGELAVVHACGLATAQRSHFEAQSATEQGIDAADPAFGTGWVGRYLNGIDGARVVGEWPGLDGGALSAGEDLAVTTDYRQVLAELLAQRLGVTELTGILGDWKPEPWQGIFLPRAA